MHIDKRSFRPIDKSDAKTKKIYFSGLYAVSPPESNGRNKSTTVHVFWAPTVSTAVHWTRKRFAVSGLAVHKKIPPTGMAFSNVHRSVVADEWVCTCIVRGTSNPPRRPAPSSTDDNQWTQKPTNDFRLRVVAVGFGRVG